MSRKSRSAPCRRRRVSSWWFSFFFSSRRRHTRLQGDWSSDVCSSDLERGDPLRKGWTVARRGGGMVNRHLWMPADDAAAGPIAVNRAVLGQDELAQRLDRKSVV